MDDTTSLQGRSGKACSGNDSEVETKRIINCIYIGKGELGRESVPNLHVKQDGDVLKPWGRTEQGEAAKAMESQAGELHGVWRRQ